MKSLLLLCALFLPLTTYAVVETHLGLGVNVDTYKTDLEDRFDLEEDYGWSPAVGFKTIFLWGNVGLRTGAIFEWKKFTVEDKGVGATDDVDVTGYYVGIPLDLQFNLNNKLSIYGGLAPRILLAKSCDHCGSFDDDSDIFINYANGGIAYMFGDTFSVDLSFNHSLQDNFENIEINTAQFMMFWKL